MRASTASAEELPDDAVILARNMGPAELLDYDRGRVRGLILEEGSPNSHVTIIARALGIPLVGRAVPVLDLVDPDDPVLLPIRADRHYRSWKHKEQPENNAVVIYMMDVSGSMRAEERLAARFNGVNRDADTAPKIG